MSLFNVLLNDYLGLMVLGFACVITLLLVIAQLQRARFEQQNQARWQGVNRALQEQQHSLQELRNQFAQLSRFQGKSSKLLLNRIERNAQLLQSGTDSLQQASVSALQDIKTDMTAALDAQRQPLEQIQQQIGEASVFSHSQGQQLAKILRATSELSGNQHQSVTALLHHLETVTLHQFTLLADEQAALKYELQQHQTDLTDSGIAALQDAVQEISDQIQSSLSDNLSELKSSQYSIEEAISAAAEELLSENQTLSGNLYQLSEELEQQIQTATDLYLAALTEAFEEIHGQIDNTAARVLDGISS